MKKTPDTNFWLPQTCVHKRTCRDLTSIASVSPFIPRGSMALLPAPPFPACKPLQEGAGATLPYYTHPPYLPAGASDSLQQNGPHHRLLLHLVPALPGLSGEHTHIASDVPKPFWVTGRCYSVGDFQRLPDATAFTLVLSCLHPNIRPPGWNTVKLLRKGGQEPSPARVLWEDE